ncbi:VOC family protein [Hymenobacter busanensis]|uniref:VOC family protein n=1 Tax=Hymenobacter busanensis TaxID=2607656 RepID=A0A7L5A3B6_9BACT|nr:VOC family protein [Hymenobacter busanensis]QHJ09686.1 VOC family protein [Hymenobacter busanensis]
MLAAAPITVMLPVVNLARARQFYEQALGLHPVGQKADGKFEYRCGPDHGTVLALFPKPNGTPADHTALSFQVRHIDEAIAELQAHGVQFEDYDLPGLKTVNHVCVLGSEKAAWFRDPEGNYLCLHEDVD